MTIEEKLKSYILEKYGSIRQLALQYDIKYTNIDSILRRGIKNATWTNVKTLCEALQIDVDALADGKILPAFRSVQDEIINMDALTESMESGSKIYCIDNTTLSNRERLVILTALKTALAIIRKEREL